MFSRKHTLFSKLQNRRGMTLTELLVSMGLSSIAIVLLASVMAETTNLSKAFEARARDEVERLTAERQLRSVFLQAVDLEFMGNVGLNGHSGSGVLREFDSDAAFGTSPGTHTLALFWRDAQTSPAPPASPMGLTTRLARTGIFFQKPTPTTWGVLYIDLGSAAAGVSPDRSDLMFEGLVRVEINNVQTFRQVSAVPAINAPVTSFDVKMTFRKFINPKGQAEFVFCPRALMGTTPACQDRTPSRDIHRTIRILTRNNVLTISPSAPANLSGPVPGKYGARSYDLVHFFKPFTPSGLL